MEIVWALTYIVCGAVFFWTPGVILHALRPFSFSRVDAIVVTFLLPLITGVVLATLWKLRRKEVTRIPIALGMLLGIWISGPLFMTVNASFSGGGFTKPEGWELVAKGTVSFLWYTFIMSTYDGTLLAVLLSTLYLVLIAFIDLWRLSSHPPC